MGERSSIITAAIINHNQRDRLRLVLHALSRQTMPSDRWEVVCVDDGSADGSADMAEGLGMPNLRVVRLRRRQGRTVARNVGIREARGEFVVLLNSDMLPCPGFLGAHLRAHQDGKDALVVGVEYTLPGTEYLEDPATGRFGPFPVPAEVRKSFRRKPSDFRVTLRDVECWSERIVPRMVRGVYPFRGGGRELERQLDRLFARYDEPQIGWLAFYSHNGSARRELLIRSGGFDPRLDPYHQGREFSYRLSRMGIPTRRTRRAKLVHLYHHKRVLGAEGFLQFQEEKIWAQEYFRRKHRVRLLDALEVVEGQDVEDRWLPKPTPVRTLLEVEERLRAGDRRMLERCSDLLDRHLLIGPLRTRIRAEGDRSSRLVRLTV